MGSATILTTQAVFWFPSEPNIHEDPEYEKNIKTISIYREKFYQFPAAQRRLLRPLNNLEKNDPSEIVNLQYKKTAESV